LYSKALINLIKEHKRIYWDWNGTLVNDVDLCIDITNSFLTSKEVKNITKDFYLKNFTIPVKEYYETLDLEKHGITYEEITESFVSNYENQRERQVLYDGVKPLLKELSLRGIEQFILSAAHTNELVYQLNKHDLSKYIKEISGADDYTAGCKLERGQALRSKHGPGIMVGDTVHDIVIGKKMGLETVWVSEGHQCWSKINGLKAVDYIFDRKTGDLSLA